MVSVRVRGKTSAIHAKARVGELLLVKRVVDRANLVEFVMGAVR